MTARPTTSTLTARETQVLQGLVDGYSRNELASRLGISRRTTVTYLGSVYRKLGVGDRDGAAAMGLRRGLVQAPS
jgi:DNA-binding CsgD family transcriptional regulator